MLWCVIIIEISKFFLIFTRRSRPAFSIIMLKRLSVWIKKVKNLIIDLVQNQNSALKNTLSDYLSTQLDCDYKYITTLFTELEGTTIEKYFIAQKIEKVKELLVYNELTLSEIAFQLQYSSVAHLSNQFKSVTGLTPSYFKNLRDDRRIPLDQVKA